MCVLPIQAFSNNYIWVIPDEETGFFACVDPGDAEPILEFAKSHHLKLRTILLTHHHHDHIGGVVQLLKTNPTCMVYGPDDSRIPSINHPVKEHQTIKVGHNSLQILFNPGHTSSHISYYEPKQGWLFCGDTLFSAGCGRVFDGTMAQLYQAMELFKSLPSATKIFCAHEYTEQNLRFALTVEPNNHDIQKYLDKVQEYPHRCTLPTTLENELLINPFLRTDVPEVFHFALQQGAVSTEPSEVFRILRQQKNVFK